MLQLSVQILYSNSSYQNKTYTPTLNKQAYQNTQSQKSDHTNMAQL